MRINPVSNNINVPPCYIEEDSDSSVEELDYIKTSFVFNEEEPDFVGDDSVDYWLWKFSSIEEGTFFTRFSSEELVSILSFIETSDLLLDIVLCELDKDPSKLSGIAIEIESEILFSVKHREKLSAILEREVYNNNISFESFSDNIRNVISDIERCRDIHFDNLLDDINKELVSWQLLPKKLQDEICSSEKHRALFLDIVLREIKAKGIRYDSIPEELCSLLCRSKRHLEGFLTFTLKEICKDRLDWYSIPEFMAKAIGRSKVHLGIFLTIVKARISPLRHAFLTDTFKRLDYKDYPRKIILLCRKWFETKKLKPTDIPDGLKEIMLDMEEGVQLYSDMDILSKARLIKEHAFISEDDLIQSSISFPMERPKSRAENQFEFYLVDILEALRSESYFNLKDHFKGLLPEEMEVHISNILNWSLFDKGFCRDTFQVSNAAIENDSLLYDVFERMDLLDGYNEYRSGEFDIESLRERVQVKLIGIMELGYNAEEVVIFFKMVIDMLLSDVAFGNETALGRLNSMGHYFFNIDKDFDPGIFDSESNEFKEQISLERAMACLEIAGFIKLPELSNSES